VKKKREIKRLNHEEVLEKKKAILTALAKASEDYLSSKESIDALDVEADDYYTLSRDEIEALVNGDMEKIEGWVSNMDKNHATRLLRWLIKERW
jgi:hypothetical protein